MDFKLLLLGLWKIVLQLVKHIGNGNRDDDDDNDGTGRNDD